MKQVFYESPQLKEIKFWPERIFAQSVVSNSLEDWEVVQETW